MNVRCKKKTLEFLRGKNGAAGERVCDSVAVYEDDRIEDETRKAGYPRRRQVMDPGTASKHPVLAWGTSTSSGMTKTAGEVGSEYFGRCT